LRNIKRKQKVCYFPEYCWDATENSSTWQRNDDDIHIVQAGFCNMRKDNSSRFLSYIDILKRFVDDGIHMHVYAQLMVPRESYLYEYGDFIELGAQNGLTHLHQNVPFDRICFELSQYDFGLSVIPEIDFPGYPARYSKTAAHYEYCGSARVTDYIDAYLPVISSPILKFQNFAIQRYGCLVRFDEKILMNPRKELSKYKAKMRTPEHIEKRSKYTIASQIKRIETFYTSLNIE